MDQLLVLLSSLLGGLNIVQLLYFRSERKKKNSEADIVAIEAQEKGAALDQQTFDYIKNKLDTCLKDYYALDDHMKEVSRQWSNDIDEKCKELTLMKVKIAELSGLQCHKTECSYRIFTGSEKKEEVKHETGN